jgi:hypothetical protein
MYRILNEHPNQAIPALKHMLAVVRNALRAKRQFVKVVRRCAGCVW